MAVLASNMKRLPFTPNSHRQMRQVITMAIIPLLE